MNDRDRKGPAPTPDQGIESPASPNSQFYEQAVTLCHRAIDAGALQEALMWAQQAELIGTEVEPARDTSEVTTAYSRIMLEACLRSQELALTTGNILPEHKELSEIISITTDRLANKLQRLNAQPKAVALMAQGYASRHRARFVKPGPQPVLVSNPTPGGATSVLVDEKRLYGAAKVDELEKMLDNLSDIERCAVVLCGPNAPTLPFDRKLSVAKTALSNARHSLVRFFSSTLSDWPMAKFFCKNAYTLLTARQISDAPGTSNNPDVDRALKQLPNAYDALERRSYKESAQHLDKVLEQLEHADKKNKRSE